MSDKKLSGAILRGFHSHLLPGRFPVVLAFLDCETSTVDVNVHPAKTEVRLQYGSEISSLVSGALTSSLRQGAWSALPRPQIDQIDWPASQSRSYPEPRERFSVPQRVIPQGSYLNPAPSSKKAVWAAAETATSFEKLYPSTDGRNVDFLPPSIPSLHTSNLNYSPLWTELRYLGSYEKCYLLFESPQGLLCVDQHAFHERILYEKLLHQKELVKMVQRLAFPECFEFAAEQIEWFAQNQKSLAESGFKFEIVSDSQIEVTEVPSFLSSCDLNQLLLDIQKTNSPSDLGEPSSLHLAAHELLATMACHGAIRAGQELTFQEVQQLIKEASKVDFYDNCPHGRRFSRFLA